MNVCEFPRLSHSARVVALHTRRRLTAKFEPRKHGRQLGEFGRVFREREIYVYCVGYGDELPHRNKAHSFYPDDKTKLFLRQPAKTLTRQIQQIMQKFTVSFAIDIEECPRCSASVLCSTSPSFRIGQLTAVNRRTRKTSGQL